MYTQDFYLVISMNYEKIIGPKKFAKLVTHYGMEKHYSNNIPNYKEFSFMNSFYEFQIHANFHKP